MERVHTLTNLTRHGEIPAGIDERVAEVVKGCCGLGQHRQRRWNLGRVREVTTDIVAAEIGK